MTPIRTAHSRFGALDGLRGWAAVLVLAHHVSFVTGESFRSTLGRLLERADAGVQVFFVLSAYLLYRPFVERRLARQGDPPVRGFWLRRVVRIFPAYWVALAGSVAFFGLRFYARTDVLVFGSLTQVYDISRFNRGISQTWSLATELGFYALLPLYAWAVRGLWGRGTRITRRPALGREVAVLCLVGLSAYAWRGWAYSTGQPIRRLIGYWTVGNLDAFALGMILALLACVAEAEGRQNLVRAGRHLWAWWAVAAVVFWAAATWVGLPIGFAEFSARDEIVRQVSYVLFATLLVAPIALLPDGPGALRRVLRSRVVGWLGLLSYGLYLWHQAVLSKFVDASNVFRAPFWSTFALGTVVSLGVAFMSYVVVERPLLEWARARSAQIGRGRSVGAQS